MSYILSSSKSLRNCFCFSICRHYDLFFIITQTWAILGSIYCFWYLYQMFFFKSNYLEIHKFLMMIVKSNCRMYIVFCATIQFNCVRQYCRNGPLDHHAVSNDSLFWSRCSGDSGGGALGDKFMTTQVSVTLDAHYSFSSLTDRRGIWSSWIWRVPLSSLSREPPLHVYKPSACFGLLSLSLSLFCNTTHKSSLALSRCFIHCYC